MPRLSDSTLLVSDQYRNASNLNARLELHRRFSANRYGWHRWVFDRLCLPPAASILELGCGAGALWDQNRDRLPAGWQICLSDLSPGMLHDARNKLEDCPHRFDFLRLDAQSIPFRGLCFEAVIANHMLYHVPDRAKALLEVSRVLKPGGCLLAATNGHGHMRELRELAYEFDASIIYDTENLPFSLESGKAELSRYFPEVALACYEDSLFVGEAEPLAAYIISSNSNIREALSPERIKGLNGFLQEKIAAAGGIRITKATGLFTAWRGL